jgi:uncharacterized alkaline shock family protein YloU
MAENTTLTIDTEAEFGDIVIVPEVLEIIIGIAASQVEGVYGMRGTLGSTVQELLGRKSHGKGVTLHTSEDEEISVDVYTYLNYGVNVPKVAMEMQEKAKEQVLYMTGIELKDVNIHVMAMIPEKISPVELADLLDDEDAEDE